MQTKYHDPSGWGIQAMDESCCGVGRLYSGQQILLPRGVRLRRNPRRLLDKDKIPILIQNIYVHMACTRAVCTYFLTAGRSVEISLMLATSPATF